MRLLNAIFRGLWCQIVGHKWVKVSEELNVATMHCERCDLYDRGPII